jgi:formamidopyrimidine-DNA glycosylase
MPELPEVETVRRALAGHVVGRSVRRVRVSRLRLRGTSLATLPRKLEGRTIRGLDRIGKYLLFDLDQDLTLISHLGMSGRWLFHDGGVVEPLPHEHIRITFEDGTILRYDDPRRFGLARVVPTTRLSRDPALAVLGPDPVTHPPTAEWLRERARGAKISVKEFLLDQKRMAGIGNIYASEILHRAGVHPRRKAGTLQLDEWDAVGRETGAVLGEAIDRMGTTFRLYRNLWNEPGAYGERLLVYDRAGEPCRKCGKLVARVVQGARSTFFCPNCQPARPARGPRPTGSAPDPTSSAGPRAGRKSRSPKG